MNEIASRYGNALFLIAKEKDKVLSYQEEVKTMLSLFKGQDTFISLLGNAFLSAKQRKEIIDQTFYSFNQDLVSLLKIIIDNNRTNLLVDTLLAFNSLANQYRGVDEGFIYSVFPLSEKQINEITSQISTLENHPLDLRNVIEPNLLGGVKVVINDHVYDGSLVHKLTQLKTSLIRKEGKSYEN